MDTDDNNMIILIQCKSKSFDLKTTVLTLVLEIIHPQNSVSRPNLKHLKYKV